MIDREASRIIDKFLNSRIFPKILDKDNLLGVVVYGSVTTGFFDKNSDIDLLVLLNYAKHSVRGVNFVDGVKIEYFIKPIEKFLSEGVQFTNMNCPSHIALSQNAAILYGDLDFVKGMLNADNTFYNENHKKPIMDFETQIVQVDNRISSLKNIYQRKGAEFEMVYYNILEMIRSLHSAHAGEANIPFVKAYRVYKDPDYYDKYVGKCADNKKPDRKFVELYSKCIEETDNRAVMLNNLIALYEYERSFYNTNPNNYELTF